MVGHRSGTKEPPPLFRSLPPPLPTCLPLYQHWILIYLCSRVHCTKVSGHSVSLFIVFRRQLCLCETAFTRRSFTRSGASLRGAHTMCALVYKIYAGGAQFVRGQKMRNQGTTPESLGQGSFTGQIAGQGASSAEKADGVKIIMFGRWSMRLDPLVLGGVQTWHLTLRNNAVDKHFPSIATNLIMFAMNVRTEDCVKGSERDWSVKSTLTLGQLGQTNRR